MVFRLCVPDIVFRYTAAFKRVINTHTHSLIKYHREERQEKELQILFMKAPERYIL